MKTPPDTSCGTGYQPVVIFFENREMITAEDAVERGD